MKDFKTYAQNTKGKESDGAENLKENVKDGGTMNGSGNVGGDGLNQTVNMAAMLAKAFNGKSEGQILQTILSQAEQGKRDGTLTNADLDNFYNALAPMLDGFKRQKLKSIIVKLKAI